jgi:hypothetical protein
MKYASANTVTEALPFSAISFHSDGLDFKTRSRRTDFRRAMPFSQIQRNALQQRWRQSPSQRNASCGSNAAIIAQKRVTGVDWVN